MRIGTAACPKKSAFTTSSQQNLDDYCAGEAHLVSKTSGAVMSSQGFDSANHPPNVIRDNESHNEKFVREQFEIFKTWIGETGIPRRS